jgi:hypothetical protein
VRAVNAHRKDIRKVLIILFEQAVPASDTVSREVLTRILCNPDEDFTAPLLDVVTNNHLNVLHYGGAGGIHTEFFSKKNGFFSKP